MHAYFHTRPRQQQYLEDLRQTFPSELRPTLPDIPEVRSYTGRGSRPTILSQPRRVYHRTGEPLRRDPAYPLLPSTVKRKMEHPVASRTRSRTLSRQLSEHPERPQGT